jgi:hypothetical protein
MLGLLCNHEDGGSILQNLVNFYQSVVTVVAESLLDDRNNIQIHYFKRKLLVLKFTEHIFGITEPGHCLDLF